MTILESINHAAGELPDNYEVVIYVENGGAWVELRCEDSTGNVTVWDIDMGGDLAAEVEEAVRISKKHDNEVMLRNE